MLTFLVQVAALAPLALLLVPEACCDHLVVTHLKYNIMLLSSALHDCSHTADMYDVVMKGVTYYKDASEHDRVLQWEQWGPCPRWRAARLDLTSR